jgi:pimeloyl-ACP methyl ester carboxylesterase
MAVGTNDAKVPVPLLLLHGALGSGEQMLRLAGAFRGERTVLAPDFPGHGRGAAQGDGGNGAGAPVGFSIGGFAQDVLALLDRNGIDRADIFGYSMGGYIALYLARHHPGRVGRIITLGTKFAWDARVAEREASRLDPAAIEAKVPGFAAQLRERHGDGWERVVRSTAKMMLELGAAPELTEADFRSIPHRALVAVGDRDAMVSIDETIGTARSLPAGECLVVPGTPHPFEQVDQELLAFHIRQFFSKGQPR